MKFTRLRFVLVFASRDLADRDAQELPFIQGFNQLKYPSLQIFKSASVVTLLLSLTYSGVFADDEDSIKIPPRPVKPSTIQVGQLFPAIQDTAIDGRKFDLASTKNNKATVIALTSTSCPICKKYVPTLAAIEKEFVAKGVQFCFLNTLPSDELGDIKAVIKNHGLKGPYIHDKTEKWNQSFRIRTTAEVFVFDSARTLVYRGAVDDKYGLGYSRNFPKKTYLLDALNSIVNGKSINVSATTAPGCDIWQPTEGKNQNVKKFENLTYHNRISRIVQNKCVECHRKDGSAPFSLETADDVKSHAGMIKTVVTNKTMPPWFAAKQKDDVKETDKIVWANDRSLSNSDKKDLLNWLASDRKIGAESDAPLAKKFTSEWNIGEPDLTLQTHQSFAIPADGTVDYQYAWAQKTFKEDKWIGAVEIRPSKPEVVHHVLVFLRIPGKKDRLNGASNFFAAYVPGNTYQIFPPGFAKKIPAGSKMLFQLHYTPNGTATRDRTKIGLKYYEGTPKHILRVQGIAKNEKEDPLVIPAGESNHSQSKFHAVRQDVKLLSFFPHMHLRGKAFKYELIDLDPKRRTIPREPSEKDIANKRVLLDIPRYDFNWQLVYRLAEPISVKAGQFIKVTGTFDNSDQNPAIKDSTKTVYWGDQTEEEMLIGYVEYYFPNEKIE